MSTARPLPRPRRARPAGFTFIEITVSISIIALMTLVIERTISGLTEAERSMRAIRNTSERCQREVFHLRDVVAGARKLFQGDAVGKAYLAKMDLPASAPMLAGSRLPLFDETRTVGPDSAGDPRAGNVLLFARESDPLPCMAVAATKKTRLVDAYRFVCVYLTTSSRTLVTGGPPALDLAEWRSGLFPSYAQVMAISTSTERTKVVQTLYTRYDVDYLWDATKDAASAFYSIDSAGNVSASPATLAKVPEDRNVSSRGRLVAANLAVARTDMTSVVRKPLMAADNPSVWAPQGFEVKIASPSGARRVWIRLTVEQQASRGRVPAYEATLVANTRDL